MNRMYKKEIIFKYLNELSHLFLTGNSYNPNIENSITRENIENIKNKTSIFFNLYDNNAMTLYWNDDILMTSGISFPLTGNNHNLMKFLVQQEEISHNFKNLLDNNMMKLAEKLEVDLDNEFIKEKLSKPDSIKKHKL